MNDQQKLHQLILAALFAAAIAVMTAYLLHIPIPTGGYIHLGDTLIYLAACLLPTPYAVMAAAIGGGLADLLTAPLWVVPTVLIKAMVALLFTGKGEKILMPRNIGAVFGAAVLSPARPPSWEPTIMPRPASTSRAGSVAALQPPTVSSQGET